MIEQATRTYFRLIQSDRPQLRDFMSHEALGLPPKRPLSRREQDRWRGLSLHDSLTAAQVKGSDSPWLGRYVAEIRIPANAVVRIEQTGRDVTHFTI